MKVVFFHRKPRASGNYSVETYFRAVRERMPIDVEPIVAASRYESNGIFKRVYNILEAAYRQRLGDVYHITGEVHFLTYLLKKKNTILTILDCIILERTKGITRWFYRFFWYIIPVKKAKIITAISESTKKEILKYVNCDPDKIVVIPVSISNKFKPLHKEYNLEKPVLLQIGTTQNKNISRLIEAIKDMPCKLEIVGKLDEKLIHLLRKNNIEYENFVNLNEDEIIKRYNNCDIVTFVSTYEGFGMPILEANAVGRPVITGNTSSMPEVAGEAACFVNPFDVSDIKNGIEKIIRDDDYRNELIKKGFINKNRFCQEKITNEYFQLYRNIFNDCAKK
ncbi:MAG: glycosyltransferase family 4 protein [Sphingobacteriaceae bacterium]|nr:glycosyltransferase family 4 protein [Sphingobacteriaceae bacterium]